jgi:hypothetical protein
MNEIEKSSKSQHDISKSSLSNKVDQTPKSINNEPKSNSKSLTVPEENKVKKPEVEMSKLNLNELIENEKKKKIMEEQQQKEKKKNQVIPSESVKDKLINLETKDSPKKPKENQNLNLIKPKKNNKLNFLIREKELNPKDYFNNIQIEEEDLEEQNCFEVDKIIGHRFNFEKKLFFLVKWKGWPALFNSWEPEDNFKKNKIVLMEYIEKIGGDKQDYQEYLEALIEFDNMVETSNSSNKDISNYVYVLDKRGYLATAENLLKNDFYMPSQIIRSAESDNPIIMGCKTKTNLITVLGSIVNTNAQNEKLEKSPNSNQKMKTSNSNLQQSGSSGLNSLSLTSSFMDKKGGDDALMPKFFNNMCEPEKDTQTIDDNNIVSAREAPARTKFYKLLKNNLGLDIKKRIYEKEEADDPALYGSFKFGDIPLRILKMEVVSVLPKEVQLNCLIEWVHRKNGFKPKNSVYSNHILKQKSPLLLINYYESNIHIF